MSHYAITLWQTAQVCMRFRTAGKYCDMMPRSQSSAVTDVIQGRPKGHRTSAVGLQSAGTEADEQGNLLEASIKQRVVKEQKSFVPVGTCEFCRLVRT